MLIYAGFIAMLCENTALVIILWILGIVFMWLEASFEVEYDTYLNES